MTDDKPRSGSGRYRKRPESLQNERQALELFAEGKTYKQIADAQNVSIPSAFKRVKNAQVLLFGGPQGLQALRDSLIARSREDEEILRERGHNPPPVVSAGKVTDVPDHNASTRALQEARGAREEQARLAGISGRKGISEPEMAGRGRQVWAYMSIPLARALLGSELELNLEELDLPAGFTEGTDTEWWRYHNPGQPCDQEPPCQTCQGTPGPWLLDCLCPFCSHASEFRRERQAKASGAIRGEVITD